MTLFTSQFFWLFGGVFFFFLVQTGSSTRTSSPPAEGEQAGWQQGGSTGGTSPSGSTASSSPTPTPTTYRLLPKKPRLPAPPSCTATLSRGVNNLQSLVKMSIKSIIPYASEL